MSEKKENRKALPVWTIFLGAVPVAAVLFLTVFRSKFAGPEMAAFEGINLCVLAHFLWQYRLYESKFSEKKLARMKVFISIYTIAQLVTTVLMMDQYFIYIYVAIQVALLCLLFLPLFFIKKENRP